MKHSEHSRQILVASAIIFIPPVDEEAGGALAIVITGRCRFMKMRQWMSSNPGTEDDTDGTTLLIHEEAIKISCYGWKGRRRSPAFIRPHERRMRRAAAADAPAAAAAASGILLLMSLLCSRLLPLLLLLVLEKTSRRPNTFPRCCSRSSN